MFTLTAFAMLKTPVRQASDLTIRRRAIRVDAARSFSDATGYLDLLLYTVHQAPIQRFVGAEPGGLFLQLFPLVFVEFRIINQFSNVTVSQQVHQFILRSDI